MHRLAVERRPGNIVVSCIAPPEHLESTGISIRYVPGTVSPDHTDAQTRAVVLVSEDAASAGRRAAALRTWAHGSLLPILVLVQREQDARHPALWNRALTCASMTDMGHITRLLAELDRDRDGLPTFEDANQTWALRRQLRYGSPARFGVGLDAFVVGRTAFVGGLLRAGLDVGALTSTLDLRPSLCINTTAVRTNGYLQ